MKNEKKFKYTLIFTAIIVFSIILIIPKKPIPKKIETIPKKIETVQKKIETVQERNWKKLINSIIFVESTNNDSAVNYGDCVGCLQITPIYIKEINKLNKLNKINIQYKLSDRYDRKKSIEMFNTYQKYKNPKKDFRKAIKLHNPTAGKWYEKRIMNYYNLN